MQQLTMEFPTSSKINKERLVRQNRIIYEFLEEGNIINTVIAREKFHVFNLHSRISDLRNKAGAIIYDRMIKIGEMNCKEYSLSPFKQ